MATVAMATVTMATEAGQPPHYNMKSKAQMNREQNIRDVLNDYRDELNWMLKNDSTPSFTFQNPSAPFITARQKRDFEEWCPVSSLSQSLTMINRISRSEPP